MLIFEAEGFYVLKDTFRMAIRQLTDTCNSTLARLMSFTRAFRTIKLRPWIYAITKQLIFNGYYIEYL